VSAFYVGYARAQGISYIRPKAGSLVRIGFSFVLEMQPFGTSTTNNRPFLYLGVSRTNWRGVPLLGETPGG
jgi:hypothetical protein